MSYTKTIVCLANSRRPDGWCVAGKEVLGGGRFGEWVRPVNTQNDDAISAGEMKLDDGKRPRLLDVITVPLVEHVPKRHQPENHQIDSGRPWTKRGVLGKHELPALVDEAYDIWRIRKDCQNDRIWESCINEVNKSLLLIRPESLTINASEKVRANFRHHGENYSMSVTDSVAEARYAAKKPVTEARYQIATDGVYLCLSVAGNPFQPRGSQGRSYFKIVAAIIGDSG